MKCLWLILMLPLFVIGCDEQTKVDSTGGINISPVFNSEVVRLNAHDIVEIMRRSGFTDEQIQKHGKSMRDGLAQSGAVQLKVDDSGKVEATFAVHGPCVYISTRLRGTFVYDVKRGWITPSS